MTSLRPAGARYGGSRIGCAAELIAATVSIGMSGFGWMAVMSVSGLLYKLAPAAIMDRGALRHLPGPFE